MDGFQERRRKKIPRLAAASIFNHFKPLLGTELEGKTVKKPFINKSLARSQTAFAVMREFASAEPTFRPQPVFKAVFKGGKDHTENVV